jgi:hypothetical protein
MNTYDKIYLEIQELGSDSISYYIDSFDYEKYNITIDMLLFIAYDIYGYEPIQEQLELKQKRLLQDKFRKDVEKKYKTCIISKKGAGVCEACHIDPFSTCENSKKYDVNNGIFLSADLHKLFDKHLFTVGETGKVIMSTQLLSDESYKDYHKYDGMKLQLNAETLTNLKFHYDIYIEKHGCETNVFAANMGANISKTQKYATERDNILNKLNNILNINDDNHEFCVFDLENDTTKQNKILELKDDVGKYFKSKNYAIFKKNTDFRPWLSLAKAIYADSGKKLSLTKKTITRNEKKLKASFYVVI